MFVLPELPYAYDALEPVLSDKTLRFHHGKHHAGYVKALNDLIAAEGASYGALEEVIAEALKTGNQKLFNNAAQAWNHSFFWQAMTAGRERPAGALDSAIVRDFGELAGLAAAFVEAGAGHFGSGWVWLVADQRGVLSVRSTHDANDTLSQPGTTALLVCDVWEHAYYLDHQNDRKAFLQAWFDAVANWSFAARQYEAALGRSPPWRHPEPETGIAPKLSRAS